MHLMYYIGINRLLDNYIFVVYFSTMKVTLQSLFFNNPWNVKILPLNFTWKQNSIVAEKLWTIEEFFSKA
jgi:hypothetical protein